MAALMELVLAKGLWCLWMSRYYLSLWTAIILQTSLSVYLSVSAWLSVRGGWWKQQHNKSGRQCRRHSVYADSIFLSSICQMTEKVFWKGQNFGLTPHTPTEGHIYTRKCTHWLIPLSPARSEREISLRNVTIFLTTWPENEAFTATISAPPPPVVFALLLIYVQSFKGYKGIDGTQYTQHNRNAHNGFHLPEARTVIWKGTLL